MMRTLRMKFSFIIILFTFLSASSAYCKVQAADSLTYASVKQAGVQPKSYGLSQNYPNPFNPVTTINYQLAKDGFVTLKIYNVLGREVVTLVKEYQSQGSYSSNFDASNLPSGVYIYELRVNGYSSVMKMTVLK